MIKPKKGRLLGRVPRYTAGTVNARENYSEIRSLDILSGVLEFGAEKHHRQMTDFAYIRNRLFRICQKKYQSTRIKE